MSNSSLISQSVIQLEATLAKKKEQLAKQSILNSFNTAKAKFQGKCFSSHILTKYTSTVYRSLIYYKDFFIDSEGDIYVEQQYISIFNNRYTLRTLGPCSTFEVRCTWENIQLSKSGELLSQFQSLDSAHNYRHRHPISLFVFNRVWNASLDSHTVLKESFKNNIANPQTEHISMGDEMREDSVSCSLSRLNIPTLDLKDYPEVYEYLNTVELPFFSHYRWLPLSLSKQILSDYCNQLRKKVAESHSDFFSTSRYIAGLVRQVDTIQSFINDVL